MAQSKTNDGKCRDRDKERRAFEVQTAKAQAEWLLKSVLLEGALRNKLRRTAA